MLPGNFGKHFFISEGSLIASRSDISFFFLIRSVSIYNPFTSPNLVQFKPDKYMKKLYTIVGATVVITALATILNLVSLIRIQVNQTPPIPPDVSTSLLSNAPTGNTLTSIQSEIAKREYHITYDSARHVLQSPNRLHNVRAYYRPGKLSIQNRIDSAGHNFRMELVNDGVYADGIPLAKAESDAISDIRNDTLTITHKGFTEEFINNQAGIRQNFIVSRVPAHTRQLSVRLSVHGLHVRQHDAGQLIFYSNNNGMKTDRLTYSDLKCWDADGKPLIANLALSGKQIEINVDVANAAYPITIDPIIANGNPANADKTLEINQSSAWLGFSVSTAGDVNGDGYSDVLVGAPKYDNGQADEGAAFLYPGTAGGISLAATVLECNQANAQMGYSVSNAGDINNDGFSDIMVGVPYYDAAASNEGIVMIYKGSANGLITNSPSVFKLDQAEANLGISVAMAGDVNGDGYSDMLAGAHQFDNGQSNEGIGALILGAPNGLGSVTFLECNQPGAMMGFAVAGAGDVDGDGFSDVMAGARLYTNGQALEGAAFVFRGSANGLITANPTVIEGNQVDARLGHALSSAGDVNGDGFSDIALGAYLYDKGSSNEGAVMIHYGSANGVNTVATLVLESEQTEAQFGISVACAGDVNADGFADLIIGARYYDKGQVNEGVAFIYQGSKDGVVAIPLSILEANQGDAWLGSAVAPAGDVNGDGFSDVLVGSYAFDHGQTDEGSVFVWYGGMKGLEDNPIILESNQIDSFFGRSVSDAGDTNADGFGDIIIGAPGFDNGQNNEGAAFVFYGSKSGIVIGSAKILEINQSDALMGRCVSSAGDVNSDGYSDVIVGIDFYTKAQKTEGAAIIYYGSKDGISTNNPTLLETNYFGIQLSTSVSKAGDINGDGYSDIAVGSPGEYNGNMMAGAAFVYSGTLNGIDPTSCKILTNNQFGSQQGISLSASDINGDGSSDLLVGAYMYDNPENNEGISLIYYGNNTLGTRNNLRLYNTDLSTPINHTQFPQTNFGAGLFTKSFTGRNKGKLVWETKPVAQGFSKGSNNRITNSTQFTASQNAFSNLGTTGLELKNVIDKQGPSTKVRMRVKYDPVLALTGQSYGPWRYLPAYLMGNGTAPVPEEKGGNLSEIIEKKAIRLEEGKASEVAKIYPNPVSSRLNIDLKDKDQVQSLRILTATGSVMYQSNELRSFVDVGKFPEGAYFLIITKTDGSLTTRQILIRR